MRLWLLVFFFLSPLSSLRTFTDAELCDTLSAGTCTIARRRVLNCSGEDPPSSSPTQSASPSGSGSASSYATATAAPGGGAAQKQQQQQQQQRGFGGGRRRLHPSVTLAAARNGTAGWPFPQDAYPGSICSLVLSSSTVQFEAGGGLECSSPALCQLL